MKDVSEMGTVEFLKMVAVRLVDVHGQSPVDPIVARLVSLARIMEAEAIDPTPQGAPDGDSPTELRDDLVKIVRMAYIGSNPSTLKAEKTVDKILEKLEQHYQAAEVASAGGVQ